MTNIRASYRLEKKNQAEERKRKDRKATMQGQDPGKSRKQQATRRRE